VKLQQENNRPVVKITTPLVNSQYDWNTPVRYSITVADKEDGDSKYQEIRPNEVFLKVKFLQDSTAVKAYLEKPDPFAAGLAAMKLSNCFNCHAFKSTLIGPSLQDISKKYPHTPANAEMMIKRIKEGSVKVWGEVPMPAHPELNAKQLQDIVQWITANAEEPDVNYLTGITGTFPLKPSGTPAPGVMVLTASYLDHGLKDTPGKNLEGVSSVVIRVK
jgi:cytochrome c